MSTAPTAERESSPAAETYAQSLGMALIFAGRMAQQHYDEELAAIGLTLRHFGALGHLARTPDASISDLARRSGVTAQSMHATVRGLEERGAVLSHDQGRGRAARLTVTPRGHELLTEARGATQRLDERLVALFGPDDAESLRLLLTARVSADTPTNTGDLTG